MTTSKAFLTSTKRMAPGVRVLLQKSTKLRVVSAALVVPRPFTPPFCSSDRLSMTGPATSLASAAVKALQVWSLTKSPLCLLHSRVAPFLGIDAMRPPLQAAGTCCSSALLAMRMDR